MQSPFKMIPHQNIILVDQRGNYLVWEVVSQFGWWPSRLGIKVCGLLSSVLYLISDFLTLHCRLHLSYWTPEDLSGIQKRLYFLRPMNLLLTRTHNADLPSPHPSSHSGISDLSVFPESYIEWLILLLFTAFMSAPGSLHDLWRLSAGRSRTCHSSMPFNMAVFLMVNLIP